MAQSNSVLQVYGGDEVGAIILDPGSHTTKIGYAGEDIPRITIPSYVRIDEPNQEETITKDEDTRVSKIRNTHKYGETSLNYAKEASQIQPLLKDSVIEDWDSVQEQWSYCFEQLQIEYDTQPLLLTEPVWNTVSNRKKSIEIALETFQFPGFYLAAQPSCSAFSLGRPSALVVDIGHDIASVTPVVDGMVLAKSTLKTHYAGRFLSNQVTKEILKRTEIIPLYQVKNKTRIADLDLGQTCEWTPKGFKGITKSFEQYHIEELIRGIKETTLVVPGTDLPLDKLKELTIEEVEENFHTKIIELPNGAKFKSPTIRNMEISSSLFRPELYHDNEFPSESGEPEILSRNDYVPLKRTMKKSEDSTGAPEDDQATKKQKPNPSSNSKTTSSIPKQRGIGALASYSLSLVDVDLRPQLSNNIILTGSTSLIPGLADQLNFELSQAHPGLKFRLHASGNTEERKNQAWIGGSILASLGTFQQMWVSKAELEEVGVERLLEERFR